MVHYLICCNQTYEGVTNTYVLDSSYKERNKKNPVVGSQLDQQVTGEIINNTNITNYKHNCENFCVD